MADKNLDKYLENLGISMEEDTAPAVPQEEEEAFAEPQDGADNPPIEVDDELLARCEAFLVDLLLNIDPAYAVEVSATDGGEIGAEIYGGDPGKIIGKNGRTLAALEHIMNAVMNREEDSERLRVNIDIGGYKRRRDDRLRQTARRAAARVRKTGFAVELEPMSAAERRVIHMELAEDPYVYSESSGEGKNRRLVVKPR